MPKALPPQPSRPDHVESARRPDRGTPAGRRSGRGEHRADRRGRLILSGVLALGLVGVVGGVANAAGVPVASPSRTDTRTTMVNGTRTVTRVHCRWWFWCSPVSSPRRAPGSAVGTPNRPLPSIPPSALPSTGPGATPSVTPSGTPSAPAATQAPKPTPAPTRATTGTRTPTGGASRTAEPVTTPPATRTPAPSSTAGDALARQILAQLNAARAAAGVSPLTMSDGLVRGAAKHSRLMAGTCGMSHRCPGEAELGARISAEGVRWSTVGENVGYGGPMPRTDAGIVSMGKQLTESMLAETPPNDGHRRNILSAGFTHVGISLYQDANGTVWMTQDFSG